MKSVWMLIFFALLSFPSTIMAKENSIGEVCRGESDEANTDSTERDRTALAPKFNQAITLIKSSFTITIPPYLSYAWPSGTRYPDGARYLKDWRLWDKNDLLKIGPLWIVVLDSMVSLKDYAHLSEILPNVYAGNVTKFGADIHEAFKVRGLAHE